jgi:LPS export ABC transporter permease LptF/LPS export ABC transporter permease LptG
MWRASRIDRYLFSEVLGPFLIGLLIYTFIMLIDFFFDSAEMIIRRGVEPKQVGELLFYYLPSTLVLTLPMALLFGILVAMGRLAGDSELTALRSGGLSLWRLLGPILFFAGVLTLLTGYLTLSFLPRGNSALNDLRMDILTSSITKQVDARVFYEQFQGLILYVFDAPPDEDRWKGVFLASTKPGTKGEVRFAESGEIRADPEDRDKLLLHLENVVTHEVDLVKPDNYRTSHYRAVDMVLEDPYATDKEVARRRRYKSLRELTVPELRRRLEEPELPPQLRNKAKVEIHKKFSIPFACLVFAFLGLPLGFNRQHSGKATGFVMSIGVIFVYWFLISNGEKAAQEGSLAPWLSMWLPNIVFLVLAVVLLARKNRDRSLLPHRLDLWSRWVVGAAVGRLRLYLQKRQEQRRVRQRGTARAAVPADFVVRLPQLHLRFPNRLDRYILVLFLSILTLALLSGFSLIVVGRLTNKIDEILDNGIPWDVVFQYLKYSSLQGTYEFVPIAVLVTTLASFGILTQRNEVTAVKALGISLYRLAIPALIGASLAVVAMVWMQNEVLPAANERAAQLEDVINNREVTRSYRRADRNWLFGGERFIYNYLHYDTRGQALQRLQVFEVDEVRGITRRLYADTGRYVGDGWRFSRAWTRSFDALETTEYRRYDEPILAAFPETPEYFESEVKRPEALSYGQLKEHIAELEQSGQEVPDLKVKLHSKFSSPAISFVMGLVALPFAFRLGRRGALYGIGIGVMLGMVFLAAVAFSEVLGETETLPPLLAAWSPAVAFSLLSLYAFLGVET